MAYDADSGDGTVYEYNASRMNEGGCVMFCLQEAIHNTFRHNVSYDDLDGTISPSENPDALIADNTFYVREGVPFVRPHMGGGCYTEKKQHGHSLAPKYNRITAFCGQTPAALRVLDRNFCFIKKIRNFCRFLLDKIK